MNECKIAALKSLSCIQFFVIGNEKMKSDKYPKGSIGWLKELAKEVEYPEEIKDNVIGPFIKWARERGILKNREYHNRLVRFALGCGYKRHEQIAIPYLISIGYKDKDINLFNGIYRADILTSDDKEWEVKTISGRRTINFSKDQKYFRDDCNIIIYRKKLGSYKFEDCIRFGDLKKNLKYIIHFHTTQKLTGIWKHKKRS